MKGARGVVAASCLLACCCVRFLVGGCGPTPTRKSLAVSWLVGRESRVEDAATEEDVRAAARPIADDSFSCGGKHVQEGAIEC